MKMLKYLFGTASWSKSTELRSIVIMQRKAHRFTEEELQAAGERGWKRKFDGKEDPMYFVSADQAALNRGQGWSACHAGDALAVSLC